MLTIVPILKINVTQLQSLQSTSLLKDNILDYISGYLVRRLEGRVKCDNCAQALVVPRARSHTDHSYMASTASTSQLLHVKDRGGLVTPTDPVFHLVKRCEQVITTYATRQFVAKSNARQMLLALFMRSVIEDRPVQFFAHTCCTEEGLLDHSSQLCRQLSAMYIDLRLRHYSRLFNRVVVEEGKSSDRGRLNRLVIFKHQ